MFAQTEMGPGHEQFAESLLGSIRLLEQGSVHDFATVRRQSRPETG